MTTEPTPQAVVLRALMKNHRDNILRLLEHYGAYNPRLFGSVARGDSMDGSDIDLMVDMATEGKDALWELSGLSEDLRQLLGVRVDVVCEKLLRAGIAETARTDLVEL
jgi:predicted nucleotidyltransferase